jgi:hypothetical protein
MDSKSTLTTAFYPYDDVTDALVDECVKLFDENYGVWGALAHKAHSHLHEGARVSMTPEMFRKQGLFDKCCSLVTTKRDNQIVGFALATTWNVGGDRVCWVTTLVVKREERRKWYATSLMMELARQFPGYVFGTASAHPAAIWALEAIGRVDFEFVKRRLPDVLSHSPVQYLHNSKPHGSLFDNNTKDGTYCSIDTQFFVDHTEPLTILDQIPRNNWPYGSLLEGHEFATIVQHKVEYPTGLQL